MNVDFSLGNWYDSIVNMLYEIRNTKKAATSLKCRIIMHYPNGQAESYFGYTDPENLLLFAPLLLRAWLYPIPYYVDGIKTFYVSSNSGRVINLEENGNISNRVKSQALISWKYLKTWEDIKITGVNTTLDMTLTDTSGTMLGNNFSAYTHSITSSTLLEFLQDVPRRTYILSCIVAALFGGAVFSFGISILWVIVFVVTRG
jgi:hypothetical protein